MLGRLLLCLLPQHLVADCVGRPLAPGVPTAGLPLAFAREVAANASVIALQPGVLQEPLASGSSRAVDCHDVHWGLSGSGVLRCNGSDFQVSTVGCVRNGCPWHRFSVAAGATYGAPSRDLAVPGASTGAPSKWTPPVLAWDGALYAAPLAADNVLRVFEGASGTEVTEISPAAALPGSFAKYGSAVLGADGFVYCIPYSAHQVMRIHLGLAADGNSSALQLFGDAGTGGYKWLHGVASQQGSIYAVPAGASTVLVIDTQSVSISELAIGQPLAASLQNYIHSVVSPEGDIFGVPADATFVLWIQPASQTVTALGTLSADSLKWMYGIVGADGRIYCTPGSATAVLRIDPATSPPTLNVTLGVGLLDTTTRKWSHAVNAPDGRIFGIPQGAAQVLVIDPFTESVDLVGPSWGGGLFKWQAGILALDQSIYAMPDDAERVLKITPNATGTDVVEEVLLGFTLPGERKFAGAAMSPSGALYAFPAYAAEVLSMVPVSDACLAGPKPQDAWCTLGLDCAVEIEPIPEWPSAVTGRNGTLWLIPEVAECSGAVVLQVAGYTNPLTTSAPEGDANRSFTFGVGLAGNVSLSHKICWAPSPTSPDIVELGSFALLGPHQDQEASCTLGLPCSLDLSGEGLHLESWLMMATANFSTLERCSTLAMNASAAELQGLANPVPSRNGTAGGTQASFSFATALHGLVGTYQLCWSPLADSSPAVASFVIGVGTLTMNGPYFSAEGAFAFRCWVGFPCEIAVDGLGLSHQNRLVVQEGACNGTNRSFASLAGLSSPVASAAGTTYVASAAGTTYVASAAGTTYVASAAGTTYAVGIPAEASPATFVVCWLAAEDAAAVDYGTLSVFGPVDGGSHVACRLNQTCNVTLDSMVGSLGDGFNLLSHLQLEKTGSCSGAAADLWGNLTNPVPPSPLENASLLFFDLLTPLAANVAETDSVVGNYSLCLSLNGTAGPFSMPVGSLMVEDVPCDVPRDILDALEPSCLSADIGMPASSLRHGEQCLPRCNAESIALVTSLQCVYGELQPPSWQCWKSCMQTPSVNNGLGQEACSGLEHGSRCDLNCPAGTLASGYFLCEHGIFYHQAALPLELLFSVPRCYRGCDATAFCGAGVALLHGERCSVVCPAGSTPDVAEVSCRDGALQPEPSPECISMCASGPDVAFATNLADCANVVSGTVCSIRCEAGYAKTGNPVCEQGIWTVERCLAPCQPPTVANASDGSNGPCESLPVGQLVSHGTACRPSCQPGFTAEVPFARLQLSCDDGVLTPGSFLCRASCTEVPTVNFADQSLLAQCSGTLHNQSCELPCVGGHVKSADLFCNDGIFSNASCIKLCYEPPFVANALPILGCSGRPSGATCEIQCSPGFSPPPGQSTALCTDGTWSEVRCAKECSAPTALDQATPSCVEGASVQSGGSCTPACREGLQPSEDALACREGVLSPPTFSCGRTCGSVGSIANSVPSSLAACSGLRYKKICSLQCRSGFRATADLLCGSQGWQQHVQIRLRGYDSFQVTQSFLLEPQVRMAPAFTLSLELAVLDAAQTNYLSILHFSATGNGCCNDGDRLPAILLVPATLSATGRKLQVFVDGSPSCLVQTPLELLRFHHLEVSLGEKLLVRLDGRLECESEVFAKMNFAFAAAYAGSPWDAPAAVELRNILYVQENLPTILPACEEVSCSLPLPAVLGADEAASSSSSSCANARAGAVCSDVSCPPGSVLTGHFRCGEEGTWRPEPAADADEVRCAEQRCPRFSPNVSGHATECVDRAIGSTCPLSCPSGFQSLSGYVCSENGQWVAMPGAPSPECTPGACGEPPTVSNAVAPEACRNLPSGSTCPGQCRPPWQPLFQYRCQAQRWVEVPLCMPAEMLGVNGTVVETVPAVSMSTLLEPSGDLRVFYTLEDWTALAEASLQLSLQRLVSQAAPATAPVAVHILGRRAEEDSYTGGRRVQSVAELKASAWKVQFQLAIVPNPLATAGGSQVLVALDRLPAGQLGESVVQALPAVARPALLRASSVAAREVALPEPAAIALAEPEGLVLSSTTTTTTELAYIAPVQSSQLEGEEANQTAEVELEEGLDEQLLLFIIMVPITCIGGFFVSRRVLRYFTSSYRDATRSDKVDFQFIVKEERLSDDTAGDVTIAKVKAYERAQTILAHKERLQEALTTGIQERASAELEAEKEQQEDGEDNKVTERVYDLRELGATKQLPNVGKAIETLERSKPRQQLDGSSMVDTSLRHQSTADLKVRSQVTLTPRDKRSILRRALCSCIGDAWFSLIEASPCLHGCCLRCCCRCCRRPPKPRQPRVAEATPSTSSSERTPEIPVTRGRRASMGRVSLSSCTAAEAVADGLERGLTAEQVFAIRQFWNFDGSEQILEDWEEKKPYRVALRGDKGDPTLASRYKSDASGGNIVTEKIMEARTYTEEEEAAKVEVHTLKFRPPSRKRIKMEIPPDSDEDEEEEEPEEAEASEPSEHEEEGEGSLEKESSEEEALDEDSISSESAPPSHKQTGHSSILEKSGMETNLELLDNAELEQIPELDADEIRAAVQRAKESPEYQVVHSLHGRQAQAEETVEEATKPALAPPRVAERAGKSMDVCTILDWR